jgi:hypothetical protein
MIAKGQKKEELALISVLGEAQNKLYKQFKVLLG